MSQKLLAASSSLWLLLLVGFSSLPSNESLLVIPSELPSILSVIYSNIPPIKKGTDSRLGFGFRVGEHADFQILLELGPQKETQPIGGHKDAKTSFNKRQVNKKEQRRALLREQLELQQQLQQQQQQQEQQEQQMTSTEHTASSWLQSWSREMNAEKTSIKSQQDKMIRNGKKPVLPSLPVLPEEAFKQLQILYKMATTTTTAATETTTETTTEPITDTKTTAGTTTTTTTSATLKPLLSGSLNLGPLTSFAARPEELQRQQTLTPKSKDEITKELMDVSLDGDE